MSIYFDHEDDCLVEQIDYSDIYVYRHKPFEIMMVWDYVKKKMQCLNLNLNNMEYKKRKNQFVGFMGEYVYTVFRDGTPNDFFMHKALSSSVGKSDGGVDSISCDEQIKSHILSPKINILLQNLIVKNNDIDPNVNYICMLVDINDKLKTDLDFLYSDMKVYVCGYCDSDLLTKKIGLHRIFPDKVCQKIKYLKSVQYTRRRWGIGPSYEFQKLKSDPYNNNINRTHYLSYHNCFYDLALESIKKHKIYEDRNRRAFKEGKSFKFHEYPPKNS